MRITLFLCALVLPLSLSGVESTTSRENQSLLLEDISNQGRIRRNQKHYFERSLEVRDFQVKEYLQRAMLINAMGYYLDRRWLGDGYVSTVNGREENPSFFSGLSEGYKSVRQIAGYIKRGAIRRVLTGGAGSVITLLGLLSIYSDIAKMWRGEEPSRRDERAVVLPVALGGGLMYDAFTSSKSYELFYTTMRSFAYFVDYSVGKAGKYLPEVDKIKTFVRCIREDDRVRPYGKKGPNFSVMVDTALALERYLNAKQELLKYQSIDGNTNQKKIQKMERAVEKAEERFDEKLETFTEYQQLFNSSDDGEDVSAA